MGGPKSSYLHFGSQIHIQKLTEIQIFKRIKVGGKDLGHASAQRWADPGEFLGGGTK
jgi:hypothetical protein